MRAYTGAGTRPLDVWTGGFMGGLMLQFNDRLFWQETGKYADPKQAWTEGGPPLKLFPCTVTTWKSWRDAHPNTDVYVGLWSAAKP